MPYLSSANTVVTFDNRETGKTGAYPDGFTVKDMAGDILETMELLGYEEFAVAGSSMGGMITQEIIGLAPERLRAAALISTAGGSETAVRADPQVIQKIMAPVPVEPDARLEAIREIQAALTGPGFADEHPDVIDQEARLGLEIPTPMEGIVRQLQAISTWQPDGDTAPPDVEVMVIHGDADPLVPYENGQMLARRFEVEIRTMAGAGHLLNVERPAELAALIAEMAGSGAEK